MALPTTLAFAGVALAMVIAPGTNMAYLVSHSIAQGRAAGQISRLGAVPGHH